MVGGKVRQGVGKCKPPLLISDYRGGFERFVLTMGTHQNNHSVIDA